MTHAIRSAMESSAAKAHGLAMRLAKSKSKSVRSEHMRHLIRMGKMLQGARSADAIVAKRFIREAKREAAE